MVTSSNSVISDVNAIEFFQESVADALSNQNIKASDDTVYYIVNLLTHFVRADEFFEKTPDGVMVKPLVCLYADAIHAPSVEQRNEALRKLGDIALFVAGVFSDSFSRKPIKIDYYIGMGVNAYAYLSEVIRGTGRGRAFGAIYDELAEKFQAFVDILAEVSERGQLNSNTDIVRLYELWLQTGSKRAGSKLRDLGIVPIDGSNSRTDH